MTTHGNIFALRFAWAVRLNGNSLSVGQLDPNSVGAGPTVSPAFLLNGPMTFKPAAAARSTVEFFGGGKPEGRLQQGISSIGDAELQLSQWNESLGAFFNDGSVDSTSLSGATISSNNDMNPSPMDVAFCAIVQVDKKSSIKGQDFLHFFYPRATMSLDEPQSQQVSGNQTNPNPVTLKISPNITDHFPGGVAFGTNQGWYNDQNFQYRMRTAYPFFLDTWIADGTATTFDLTYLPVYSDVTSGKTNNWVTKNGTETAPTSISTSTKAVVISAAGSASDIWNLLYMVDPTNLV